MILNPVTDHSFHQSVFCSKNTFNLLLNENLNLILIEDNLPQAISLGLNNKLFDFQFWFYNQNHSGLYNSLSDSLQNFLELGSEARECIIKDVCRLNTYFYDITGDEQPFVSLRSINYKYFMKNENSVSRCFHRDTSYLTLFRTYYGCGTEWVSNDNVKRSLFQNMPIQPCSTKLESYLFRPNEINTTTVNEFGILKGEINPDGFSSDQVDFLSHFCDVKKMRTYNVDRGLIHRGPIFQETDFRFLLTISSFNPLKIFRGKYEAVNL